MLGGIFYNLDANIIVFGLLFVIFFVFIQLALWKTLKDKNSASIIAFCISILATYGIYRTGFDLSGIFYNIGISDTILYTVIPVLVIAGLIFIFWKVRFRFIMVILGLILIIGSRFVYEKTIVLIVGIATLIFGIILMMVEANRERKRKSYMKFVR